MSKSKKKARNDPFNDEEVGFDDSLGTNIDDLVEDVLETPGKPKKLSILLPKEPEDFFGDEENNDEEEKERQRQREKDLAEKQEKEKQEAQQSKVGPSAFGVLANLNPQELEDHYFKCIQLCNQNKVNVKNAFKLQLIDYMKLIFTKHSKKTENLALMGYTLDASAKIYSYRVDKVYADMMKVMSGKVFKESGKDEEATEEDGDDTPEGDDDDGATPKKKRKKNYMEENELDFEKVLCSESDLRKNQSDGDGFLKERTTLPPHLEFFLECPLRNPKGLGCLNGPVFDSEDEEISSACNSIGNKTQGNEPSLEPSEWLPVYNEMHKRFFLLGDTGSAQVVNKSLAYDSTLQDPLVEPFRNCEDDDEMLVDGVEPMQMVDYDDGFSDDEPSASIVHNPINSTKNKSAFSIKGMSSMISMSENEYSYFDSSKLNFWAGPSHWSIKPQKRTAASTGEVIGNRVSKKNNYVVDFFEFNAEKIKNLLSESTVCLSMRTVKTWSRDKNRNINFSYTPRKLLSLFHDETLVYTNKNFSAHGLFSAAKSKLLDEDCDHLTPEAFNCQDDEPEVNMLDNHPADDDDHFGDDQRSLSPLHEEPTDATAGSTGLELLPAPPKVNKININFSKSQKRVDIKLLKNTIWKFMDLESNTKENIPDQIQSKSIRTGPVHFSDVFTELPNLLPPEEAAQISCGIVFMAVLHMANEKTLALQGNEDHSDFKVLLG